MPKTPNYKWWVEYKSVWRLEDAASLYLGFEPGTNQSFHEFDSLIQESHKNGFILTDRKTVWHPSFFEGSDASVGWDDIFDYDNQSRISLRGLVEGKIKAGEIDPIPSDASLDDLYFHPKDIVSLFQDILLNIPPKDLLLSLGLKTRGKNSKSSVGTKNIETHKEYYQKYLDENEKLYIDGKIKKPWKSQIDEEVIIRQLMVRGFNRTNFREARKKVLAKYPYLEKVNLSASDHEELKAFIYKQNNS
jgi:hypothetical protein